MSLNLGNEQKMSLVSTPQTIDISNHNHLASARINGLAAQIALANTNAEADSGRASMASNNDQDQCSPTTNLRNSTQNQLVHEQIQANSTLKITCKNRVNIREKNCHKQTQEMLINQDRNINLIDNERLTREFLKTSNNLGNWA